MGLRDVLADCYIRIECSLFALNASRSRSLHLWENRAKAATIHTADALSVTTAFKWRSIVTSHRVDSVAVLLGARCHSDYRCTQYAFVYIWDFVRFRACDTHRHRDVCRSNAVGFQSYVEGFPVLKQCFRTIPIDMRQGGYGESAHVTDGKGLNAGKLW